VRLVEEFPEQPFVLDHIAKPFIRDGQFSPWREDLRRVARFPNVTCKLSGLVTEARWDSWRPEDIHPYLDIVVEAFGPSRLMIGSDWPVCLLAGDYGRVMDVVVDYVERLPGGRTARASSGRTPRACTASSAVQASPILSRPDIDPRGSIVDHRPVRQRREHHEPYHHVRGAEDGARVPMAAPDSTTASSAPIAVR
jgi:hypothetical protein